MFTKKTLGVTAALTALAATAFAQTTTTTPPRRPGILGHIFHRPGSPGMTRPGGMTHHGMMPAMPGMAPIGGGIIGNKRTHVYHMAGDRGALPSTANRVYFRTEAQAAAAGYHRAGVGHGRPGGMVHH